MTSEPGANASYLRSRMRVASQKDLILAAMQDSCPECMRPAAIPSGLVTWRHQYTGHYWCPGCDHEWECSWNRQMIDERAGAK